MSEVEKMYENAGVGYLTYIVNTYPPMKYPQIDFSAEKQLELVKWILFSKWWMSLKVCQFAEKFDERLAELVNDIWQDLTEEERTEIAEILN